MSKTHKLGMLALALSMTLAAAPSASGQCFGGGFSISVGSGGFFGGGFFGGYTTCYPTYAYPAYSYACGPTYYRPAYRCYSRPTFRRRRCW